VSPSEWKKENGLNSTKRKRSAKKSTPPEKVPEPPKKSTQSDEESIEVTLEFGSCFE
jgi:hypothetical protein